IVLDASHVWLTANAGVSWTNVTGTLSAGTLRSIAFDTAANALLVGSDKGVFMTSYSSPGGSWTEVGDIPNAPVTDLRYDSFDDVLVAGTLGRGAWKITGATSALTN